MTADADGAKQMQRSRVVLLVNELMKPQWTLFCGKVRASEEFTDILPHISTGWCANIINSSMMLMTMKELYGTVI